MLRRGTVTSFGSDGWGLVTDDADDSVHPFHSTAIADGTRSIAEGKAVTFTLVPGRLGRWEAAGLR